MGEGRGAGGIERQIGAREMGERLGKEAVDSVDKYLSTSNGKEMPYVLLYMTNGGKSFEDL